MPMPIQNFGIGEGGLRQLIQALMMQQAVAQPQTGDSPVVPRRLTGLSKTMSLAWASAPA